MPKKKDIKRIYEESIAMSYGCKTKEEIDAFIKGWRAGIETCLEEEEDY